MKNFAQCNLTPTATLTTVGNTLVCGSGSIALSVALPATNSWAQKTDFAGDGRSHATAFSVGNKGYIGLGYSSSGAKFDLWEFDPSANTWTQKADIPSSHQILFGFAFSIGTKAYVGGGDGVNSNLFFEFDPVANTWISKTPLAFDERAHCVAFSIGGLGYICAGINVTNSLKSTVFLQYDPVTDTWSSRAPSPNGPRSDAIGFSIGNKGYFGLGYDITNTPLDDFWEYNPATNAWIPRANYGGGVVDEAVAFSIGSKGYVRSSEGGLSNGLWQFDPVSNTWSSKTDSPDPYRSIAVAFSIGGKGYIGTGVSFRKSLWEYSPELGYAWSTGATTPSIAATASGNYSVTITDLTGCGTVLTQSFGVNPLPAVTISGTSTLCAGGSVVLTAAGASTYTWSSNAASATTNTIGVSPPVTITYTVTGTSAAGCTNTAVKTVTVYNLPTVTASAVNPVICMGGTTALNGSGATMSYSWTGGVTNGAAFSPTVTTTYTLTGTDFSTCSNTAVQTVTVNNLPTVTANASSTVICLNNTVTLSGSGASTYTWTGGISNGVSFSPTLTTTYTVMGTDANTCKNTAVKTISVNNLPVVTASTTNSVICMGYTTALNGVGASTYTWTSGVTNGTAFSPTITATYTLTGTNAATGCTNTAVKTITVNNLPNVTASAVNPVICMGGTTTLNGGGASTYTWMGGVTNGSSFSPALTTTYTVTGTDANTCTNTAVKTITVNALPTITANATSTVICFNNTVTLSGAGASTYTWTGGISNGSPFSPTVTTTYTVTGTDVNTCTNTAVKTISVNNLPPVTASTTNSVICVGYTTSLNGGGAVTYTWTNGVTNGSPFSPTITATYTVMGMDANTCTNTAVKSITVHNLPTVTASVTKSVICIGDVTTLSGGGAVTYTWSDGVINGSSFAPSTTAVYTVTGTDANTCTNTAVKSITVNNLPTITASVTKSVICMGDVTTLNGGGAVTYTWTNGVTNGSAFSPTVTATYTVTGTDANTCTNTAVKTITVNNLPNVAANTTNSVICIGYPITLNGAGAITYTWTNGVVNGTPFSPTITATYTVTGTDANTCTNTAVQSVIVNNLPTVTASVTKPVICIGDVITLSGGGAVTYTWTSGVSNGTPFTPSTTNSYTVTGTDANTCTNTAVKSITVNNLPIVTASVTKPVICVGDVTTLNGGGAVTYTWTNGVINGLAFSPTITATYTVTGTDANTCTNIAVKSITVNNLPTVTAGTTNSVICIGFSTTLNGGGAVTYTWTNGVTNGASFTPTITNTYTVTGTDANTCTNTAVKTITVNNLPVVTASASSSFICLNYTTSLHGGGAVTYTWSNSVTNAVPFVPSVTRTYTVTGTDANTCTNTAVRTITVNSLPVVTANTNSPSICYGKSTTLNGAGAALYFWTGGVTDGVAFSPTITTTYTVTGMDVNTCTTTAVKTITVYNLPTVTASVTRSVICTGDNTILNGGGASTYTWTSSLLNGVAFSPTITATYTVTGTDVNTCTNTAVKTITVNNLPIVTASVTKSVICFGESVTLNGGGAVTYTWTNGVTDNLAFSPAAATHVYTVTGTDANTCTNTAVQSVTVHALPNVTASAVNPVICMNGTTTLNGGGASTYTWTGGVTDASVFSPTATLTYTVTGTDINTCTNTAMQTVTVNALPVVTASASHPVICLNGNTTLNGAGAITYTWTGGVSNGVAFLPTATLTYTVTGTDANTCTNTAVQAVTVNPLPAVTAIASSPVICRGFSTTLNGGGAVTYTWTNGITDGVAFSPTNTITYTVIGTDANTCTNTAHQTVTVNALPIITAFATPSVICETKSTTIIGGGALTYTITSGVPNGAAFAPSTTGNYTISGTNANGCVNSKTLSVIVNTVPVVSASASTLVICRNEPVTFSSTGATTYTWTGGVTNGIAFTPTGTASYSMMGTNPQGCVSLNTVVITVTVNQRPALTLSSGGICIGQNYTLIPGGAATYTFADGGPVVSPTITSVYHVTGTSPEGCISTTAAVSTVTVYALPVINLSPVSDVLCLGTSGSISASGASTYSWSTGDTTPAIAITPTVTSTYSVTGTSVYSCVNSNTIIITVATVPTVNLVSNKTAVCDGGSVILSATGAQTYSWNTGEHTASISNHPNNKLTTYTVTGFIGKCTDTKTISVAVYLNPDVALGPDAEITAGETYQIRGAQIGGSIFAWSPTEGLSNGNILNPVTSVDHTITYTLTVISPQGCTASDEITITVSEDLVIANYMSPNGDGKNDTWKVSNTYRIKDYSVEIIDGWGKTVFSKLGSYENEFSADDLPDGVYYYFMKEGAKIKYKGSITVTR